VDAIPLLCSGSDVIGPELQAEIMGTTNELVALLEGGTCEHANDPPRLNCSSPTLIAGILTRVFWLGYELKGVESSDSGE